MDSITHLALGACMGEAFAGKTLGKKAMLWGALAQSIPDIDFVASFWMDTPSALLAHRGFTHSFLCCLLIAVLLGFMAEKLHRPHNIRLGRWMAFFGLVIFIHLFIDAFNNYGVGWLEPFSHHRVTFNAIYVADPLFSVWPGIAVIAMLLTRKNHTAGRKKWWRAGLGMAAAYLLFCLVNKAIIDAATKKSLRQQHISYTRYFTTPAPLQNWLWFVVAGDDKGYHAGFRSLLDSKKEIVFQYFPRNDSLLEKVDDHEALQRLVRFSKQFYTTEKWGDTLVFNDLRFGQVIGWQNPKGPFVFHYYLAEGYDNKLVIQRGRFQDWNKRALLALLHRMKGN